MERLARLARWWLDTRFDDIGIRRSAQGDLGGEQGPAMGGIVLRDVAPWSRIGMNIMPDLGSDDFEFRRTRRATQSQAVCHDDRSRMTSQMMGSFLEPRRQYGCAR